MVVRRPIPAPVTFGSLVKICVACYYSNHQARNLGGAGAKPPKNKFFRPLLEKCVEHSLKNGPLKKLIAPTGVPSWLWAW